MHLLIVTLACKLWGLTKKTCLPCNIYNSFLPVSMASINEEEVFEDTKSMDVRTSRSINVDTAVGQ
jgi:hypothetical protein